MLNVPIANIFETLQINLGTAYVNDFNAFGRVYQVRAQADQRFRVEQDDINRLQVRSSTGALVPLGTLVDDPRRRRARTSSSATTCTRRCRCRGTPRPASRRARRSTRWRSSPARALPPGMGFEWTELAFQERATGNTAIFIFALVGALRLPGARRAVRELVAAARHHPDRADGVLSALRRRDAARAGQQHPDPDRPRRAGRPRGQERDPDRRVRQAAEEREGKGPVDGGDRGLPAAPAPDPDDGLRLHPRRACRWSSRPAPAPRCARRSARRCSSA